jgi:hypothetical protein
MAAAQKTVTDPARPGIAIRGLRKFGTVQALDGVDLDVRPVSGRAMLFRRTGSGR